MKAGSASIGFRFQRLKAPCRPTAAIRLAPGWPHGFGLKRRRRAGMCSFPLMRQLWHIRPPLGAIPPPGMHSVQRYADCVAFN